MFLSQWTHLDIFFGSIVIISTLFAVLKGLSREIISLVSLIGGFVLAVLYYQIPSRWLASFIENDVLADLIGFLIFFAGCILIGIITAYAVNRMVKAASLKWVDRILGGIFGFLRGWAISSIMVIALVAFPIRENMMEKSLLAPFLLSGARTAVLLVPRELKDKFNEHYKKVLRTWNESRTDV